MTGAKVLRRIASWLLFLAAATWFLVETIELATAPYLAAYDGEITDLFSRFYLPLLYVVLFENDLSLSYSSPPEHR